MSLNASPSARTPFFGASGDPDYFNAASSLIGLPMSPTHKTDADQAYFNHCCYSRKWLLQKSVCEGEGEKSFSASLKNPSNNCHIVWSQTRFSLNHNLNPSLSL